jgi:hypothetical protein
MRTLPVFSIVSLVIGVLVGGFIGYQYYATHVTNEAVDQAVQGIESADGAEAARDARAIEAISSGDTQRAVELLSGPVAHYYSNYPDDGRHDRRARIRSLIHHVASSNEVLAARIAEASTNQLP